MEHCGRFIACCGFVVNCIKTFSADCDRTEGLLVGFTICLVVSVNCVYSWVLSACVWCAFVPCYVIHITGGLATAFSTAASSVLLPSILFSCSKPSSLRLIHKHVFIRRSLAWFVDRTTIPAFSTTCHFVDVRDSCCCS